MELITSGVEVRILLCDFRVLIYAFKVPGSSACTITTYRKRERRCSVPRFHHVSTLTLTWSVQRMPDCEMVLVHEDDLERILRVNDGTVSKDYCMRTH